MFFWYDNVSTNKFIKKDINVENIAKVVTESVSTVTLWDLIKSSDAITWAVLFTLLTLSIIAWTIFVYKFFKFKTEHQSIDTTLRKIEHAHSLEQLINIKQELIPSLSKNFISEYLSNARYYIEANKAKGLTGITSSQHEALLTTADQVIDTSVHSFQSTNPFFATTVAISPLLGLFGTVWGLIHAFMGISQQQSADIAAVAPGIAEALITTLAGLLVAMPALVMLNYINHQSTSIERKLVYMLDRIDRVIQTHFIRS